MKQRTKSLFLTLATTAAAAVLGVSAAALLKPASRISMAESDSSVLYEENFDTIPEGLSDKLELAAGGGALIKVGDFDFPITKTAESNNYEVSFKIKYAGESHPNFRVIVKGLNDGQDIPLWVEGDGQYWQFEGPNNARIYNNSGDDHGGLDWHGVDLSEFATVKLVHFEGYVELWINGTRRIVSHLSNFGNNNYNVRTEITEGTITGITVAASANKLVIDDILVKEAVGGETSYYEAPEGGKNEVIFPLSAQNLYRDSYKASVTFDIKDKASRDWFPTLRLMGANASLTAQTGASYCVNIQCWMVENSATPQVYYQNNEAQWIDCVNHEAVHALDLAEAATLTYRAEVYGDNFKVYMNDVTVVDSTFTQLGFKKGHLQYLWIRTGGPDRAVWSEFSYNGYESTAAVDITTTAKRPVAGETLTFKAYKFGTASGDFSWYVNDVKQTETSETLTLTNVSAGALKVEYKSDALTSNTINLTVEDRRISVVADKESLYPTEEVTFTATLDGDFSSSTMVWTVNGEEQTETGTTLTLSSLAAGEYKVVYKTGSIVSNEVTVTVKTGVVKVSAAKNSYFDNETKATLTATTVGIPEGATIAWYVDGEVVAGATSATYDLPLAGHEVGSQIIVKCKVGDIESEEATISIVYDIYAKLSSDPEYKEVSKLVLDPTQTYDCYSVGTDTDGSYYLYDESTVGPWFRYKGEIADGLTFVMEYKAFIPEDINGKFYVYPCLEGMNSKYPSNSIETAFEVNPTGIRPYIKDQGTNKSWEVAQYGFGKDLSYGGGVINKGEWTKVTVTVDGMYVGMYFNDQIVLFFKLASATVPTGIYLNMWPDDSTSLSPILLKDLVFSKVDEPAPALTAVNLTVSAVEVTVGTAVTVTAKPTPYNAKTENIKWYVNGSEVAGSELVLSYTPTAAGSYVFKCVIDGINSTEKTITVTAASTPDTPDNPNTPADPDKKGGCKSSITEVIAPIMTLIVAAGAVVVWRRKKHN